MGTLGNGGVETPPFPRPREKYGLAMVLVFVSLITPGRLAGEETVDRIVASIGHTGITESDVAEEYRFEAFARSGRIPTSPPDAAAFRRAESRLIDQKVLEQQLANYLADSSTIREQAEDEMDSIRKETKGVSQFEAGLRSLGLSTAQFLSRLEEQQRILTMIDDRLRPAAAADPGDIQTYYRKTFLPEFKRQYGDNPPPLSQVQDKIRKILAQRKIDQLLQQWLSQLKREQHVQILSE